MKSSISSSSLNSEREERPTRAALKSTHPRVPPANSSTFFKTSFKAMVLEMSTLYVRTSTPRRGGVEEMRALMMASRSCERRVGSRESKAILENGAEEAKRAVVERAMPGPEPTTRRVWDCIDFGDKSYY